MAKRAIVVKSSEGWPGEPVPKERMIALVREKFSLKNLQGNLHFCTEYPNFQRPADRLYVAESGVQSAEDVRALSLAGADAILMGEVLMRAENKGLQLQAFREAAR